MTQFIVVFAFFIVALGGFWLALHFSQYKKRPSGCCGGVNCGTDGKHEHHGDGGSCHREKLQFVDNFGKQNA